MKRRSFVHGTTAGALVLGSQTVLAQPRQFLRAAAAEVVVTPEKGAFLVGPMKAAEGTHDDLFARVLILDDGDTRLVIATLDYLGFDFAYTNLLLEALAAAAATPVSHVMLNCSHTHSAPLTAPWGPWLKEKDLSFHRFLPERLAIIAKQAVQALRPARIRHHREPTQIGFNRRLLHEGRVTMAPNPNGAVLPWVDVLAIEEPDGGLIASLFSHAAHPVIVHDTSSFISGDFPGFAVQTLRKKRSGKAIHLFAQGCAGNINAFPLKGGLGAAKAAGRDLGEAVLRALNSKTAKTATGTLKTSSLDLKLPHRPPPPAEELRAIIAREKDPGTGKRARREALLTIAEKKEQPTMPFPIRAFAIGEKVCLLGMPSEPFAEYHRFAETVSPFAHTFAFGYTNGLECYVGTRKDYELGDKGGYETSPYGAALMFESRLPLALEAEGQIHDGIRTVLSRLGA
jgi:neutral ceramidase